MLKTTSNNSCQIVARGVIYIHSAPTALRPHIEWAIRTVLPRCPKISWITQPVEQKSWRTEISWVGKQGSSALVASNLKSWPLLRFEVTEEPSAGSDGFRYAYTPALGLFSSAMSVHGDVLIHEEKLKKAVIEDALGECPLNDAVEKLLGIPWDNELESFRYASEMTPVRWLHKVV